MKPLTKEQFRDALQKGLGRAVLHVKEFGAEGLEEDILDACLHCRAYDGQAEGSRDQWMLSIIELAGKQGFYFPKILKAHSETIEDDEGDHDLDQLNGFMFQFAKRKIPGARESLYKKFDSRATNDSWLGRTEIVELDGLEGFIHIANILGKRLIEEEDYFGEDYLFNQVSEKFSEEEVRDCLSLAGETNPNVKKYFDVMLEIKEESEEKISPGFNELSINEVFNIIDTAEDRSHFFKLRMYGGNAKTADIEKIFNRLLILEEKDKNKIWACLQVFSRRAFPRLEARLFDWLESEDEDIRYSAIWAMANVQDKKVREFATNHLKAKGKESDSAVLKLLVKNYEPGDHGLIESSLGNWDDPDDCHDAALNLRIINEENEKPELAMCYVWAYEHTPCSFCREFIVENLVDWNMAPKSMLEECLWDCQEDTVELAKSTINKE